MPNENTEGDTNGNGAPAPKAADSGSPTTPTAAGSGGPTTGASATGSPATPTGGSGSGTSGGAPSTPETKQPPKMLTPEQALDLAAKAEWGARKRREQADREVADARAAQQAAEARQKEADEKLAKLGRAALADEKLSKGEQVAAIKELMGDAYNPGALMEALSLDVKVPGEDGAEEDNGPSVTEQIEAAIDAREKKRIEEATATAATKKAEEDKKRTEHLTSLRNQFDADLVAALSAEKHPLLWERFQASLDLMSEADAKKVIAGKGYDAFQRVYREKKEALEPDEVAELLELELQAKRDKKPKAKTVVEEVDAELEALDRQEREARSSEAGSFTKDEKQNTRAVKIPGQKTMVEWAHEQLEEMDRRAGNNRMF